MELIKLSPTTGEVSELAQGEQLNGWTKVQWVERYQTPGEFKITAPLSSGLVDTLPLGSFVSHIETREAMMVENIEILQSLDEDSECVISGRSYVAFMENRTTGENTAAPSGTLIPKHMITTAPSWDQIETLIYGHLNGAGNALNNVPGTAVNSECSGTSTSEAREIKIGTVLERVLELLKIDDIGIKVRRPSSTESLMYYILYQGANKTADVNLNWSTGDITNLATFFSSKKRKNVARVVGRWVQLVTNNIVDEGYDRRTILVDATDIDNHFNSYPTGGDLTATVNAMLVRGREALSRHNEVSITSVDISDNAQPRYRYDYNLGDLITVRGAFGINEVKRVSEFAETADANGQSGIPTLITPGED